MSGYALGVNPFDQPGVEAYKKNMFALLGKPGYEEQGEELRQAVVVWGTPTVLSGAMTRMGGCRIGSGILSYILTARPDEGAGRRSFRSFGVWNARMVGGTGNRRPP